MLKGCNMTKKRGEKPPMSDTDTVAPERPRRAIARLRPSTQQSRVTNGRSMFVDGDGNSAWTRRFKDLVANHASDLGGGELLSEAQVSLIRRAATMEIKLEEMEGCLSKART